MSETESKTFQWIKGDKAGHFVKWSGEILDDGGMNFLIFTDGTRANEDLLGDYFLEVASELEGFVDIEMMKPEPSYQPLPPEHNPPLKAVSVPVSVETKAVVHENPITRLLLDSKKQDTKIKLDISLEMPSVELMKVLADSYQDGEEHVLEFLATTISDIRSEVAKQIWIDINKKQKTAKNETA